MKKTKRRNRAKATALAMRRRARKAAGLFDLYLPTTFPFTTLYPYAAGGVYHAKLEVAVRGGHVPGEHMMLIKDPCYSLAFEPGNWDVKLDDPELTKISEGLSKLMDETLRRALVNGNPFRPEPEEPSTCLLSTTIKSIAEATSGTSPERSKTKS
jgi:hypothetical protein